MTEPVLSNPTPLPQPVAHLDALPAGTRLGEFEITGLLGVGGFGMVYQAFDHSLQRDVAIKEYMPAALARRVLADHVSVHSSADAQTFTEGLKSFMAEARLLAQFDHASLVKVFRYWEANNTAYMVMPLYRGITLRQARAAMRTPPPEAWLRKILWSVLGALKVLHSGNTMHRDISPENIFLQDVGPPVLLDLGAARRAIHEQNQQITATLKYSYAPIEQYGEEPDLRQGPWTDLYALAAVVHGCVSNELPLPATLRVMRDRLPSFASVAKRAQEEFGVSYSPAFVSTIDHSLALRPAGRPKSANGFARMMGLHVPSGMSKFDWRAELGDILSMPAKEDDAASQAVTVLLSSGATLPAAPQDGAAPTASPDAPLFTRDERRAAPRWTLWLAGLAMLLLLAVAVWRSQGEAPPAAPSVAPGAAPAPVVAPEPAAAVAAMPVATEAASPASAAVLAASAVQPQAIQAQRKAQPKPMAERKKLPEVAAPVVPTPAPGATRADAAEAAAGKAQATVEAAPAPAPARSPEAVCADRNFLVRPMCLYQECQKPEFSRSALCLENATRLREARPARD